MAMEDNMKNFYDVVVVGGGPAGLTAAIYLARAKYRVIVVEKETFGGQITITSEVVNYPGVKKTSGTELTENMRKQAESFGAEFMLAEVTEILPEEDIKTVKTSRGEMKCFGVLLATGAHPRTIGFDGEEKFKGHGVAYCATCDGEFFTGKEIFVIGGGFAAAEESVFLTKYAKHVTILIRESDFTCAKSVADEARKNDKITVITEVEVEKVDGEDSLNYIRYRHLDTGEITEYRVEEGDTFGVFVFAGYEPATELIKGIAELDKGGYVITDNRLMTSQKGIFAAGDVCVKALRQVATAVGDGALAATEMEKYAAEMQEKTGIHPVMPESDGKTLKDKDEIGKEKSGNETGLFSEDMLEQLNVVFSKLEAPLILSLKLDNSSVSEELKEYIHELAKLTDRLTVEETYGEESKAKNTDSKKRIGAGSELPCVEVLRENGEYTGLAFHGVPGGHEFTSFILGLYNAAGKGQALDDNTAEEIDKISEKTDMKILVSLSCTMCPELVTAAQKIASMNELVSAEVYDLNHFPELRDKYKVMSVPCLVINNDRTYFGKKNISQLIDIINKN